MDKENLSRISTAHCCYCGVSIGYNQLNICSDCIKSKVDITEDLIKQYTLSSCNKCERFWQPPNAWHKAPLESKELLTICLKRIKGLNKLKLIDASFIWTEPHSKRLKVKIIVEKEVNSTPIQQTTVIDFTITNKICEDCQRVEAKDFWNVVIQVRQRVHHKKTFYHLEQLILKSNMHQKTVNIKQVHDGIDFYFSSQGDARRMLEFLESTVPCKYTTSKRLISQDFHNNTYNYKYTYSVEIVPICKDDIICLPEKISKENGRFGPICICTRITSLIHLIDPRTLKTLEFDASAYWRSSFHAICSSNQLREFTVMDIETTTHKSQIQVDKEASKYQLADVWVMKSNEVGVSEKQYHTKTHLGHLLNVGDTALGFDLTRANLNDPNIELLNPEDLPDIVLVRKVFDEDRHKQRRLKLKRLPIENEENKTEDKDYFDFLAEIEDDSKFEEYVVVTTYTDHVDSSNVDDEPNKTKAEPDTNPINEKKIKPKNLKSTES